MMLHFNGSLTRHPDLPTVRIYLQVGNPRQGDAGFENIAASMMQQTVKAKGVPSIQELRDICVESGVRLVACQMTVGLFNFRQDEFIPEIAEWIGATSYLAEARKADVCLFI